MYKLDVIAADGGYRVAWHDAEACIVITNRVPYKYYFPTKNDAEKALDTLYSVVGGKGEILEEVPYGYAPASDILDDIYDTADDIAGIQAKIDAAIDADIGEECLTADEDMVYSEIECKYGVDAFLDLARAWGWEE